MKAISFGATALLALAAGAAPAAAQYREGQAPMAADARYRDGQPLTLAPPYQGRDAGDMASARFASRYRQARSPRVVVFWNREFTDEVASRYELEGSLDAHSQASGSSQRRSVVDWRGAVSDKQADASADTSVHWREGIGREDSGRHDSVHERATDLDIEQAFTGALRAAGVRLVDRASIMRRAGLREGRARDVQSIETAAVMDSADLILEVYQVEDSRQRDGITYRIVARDLAHNSIRTSLNSSGRPMAKHMPYVAGPTGFVRATPAEPTPSDIGRQLAVETMSALATTL